MKDKIDYNRYYNRIAIYETLLKQGLEKQKIFDLIWSTINNRLSELTEDDLKHDLRYVEDISLFN